MWYNSKYSFLEYIIEIFDNNINQKYQCISNGFYTSNKINNELIDTDSVLRGLNIPLSKNPPVWQKVNVKHNHVNFADCNKFDYTRLSNPISTSKELGINRFNTLLYDPQTYIKNPDKFQMGVNTKMMDRDNYKWQDNKRNLKL